MGEAQLFRKRPIIVKAYRTTERTIINTLEGDMVAEPGDWIITGIKGERYPCKHDVFVATYDSVVEEKRDGGRKKPD